MSAWFESQNYAGMAGWMRIQAQEELLHALKFVDFVNERSGRVLLAQVDAPETTWESPLAAFGGALAHEQMITGRINDLVDLALAKKDHASNSFLQWFVAEQVEEEATATSVVDKLKLVGDSGPALYMLDGELGQRPAPAPAAAGAE